MNQDVPLLVSEIGMVIQDVADNQERPLESSIGFEVNDAQLRFLDRRIECFFNQWACSTDEVEVI